MRRITVVLLLASAVATFLPSSIQAQLAVPAYSSRPGAAYTLYLDFGGFNFTGTWGGSSSPSGTPGNTPAYDTDGNAASFSATELGNIQKIWAWHAEKYSVYNVNVTTVDPAPNGSTMAQRQAFYDQTARLQHQVIGGSGAWSGGGGVSFLNVISSSFNPAGQNGGAGAGFHTNWVFSQGSGNGLGSLQFVSEAGAHENGHAFGLQHQSDRNAGGTKLVEYSGGNWTTTGALGGNGTVAPTMGVSYYAQRGTWRNGSPSNSSTFQNDSTVIQGNAGIGNFINDGIGRTLGTATPLPMTNGIINSSLAKGIIVPVSNNAPNPIGVANYTSGFFSFSTSGGNSTINLVSGGELITPGTADLGAMLDGSLSVLDSLGNTLFSANTITLGETLNVNLAAGNYFIRVDSAGGKTLSSLEQPTAVQTQYYDMGSYFLTGVIAVPEPATIALCGAVLGLVGYQGWRVRRNRLKALEQKV